EKQIPQDYRWADLESHEEKGLLGFYQEMLTHLGANVENEVIRALLQSLSSRYAKLTISLLRSVW
ncbi:hypothetical protein J7S49_21850, partial [Providencia rettgeri]|uniref:hypothetical protein n=1 Tax=Providencia rettgeri TaxID=587 RepID=UPI001B37CF09